MNHHAKCLGTIQHYQSFHFWSLSSDSPERRSSLLALSILWSCPALCWWGSSVLMWMEPAAPGSGSGKSWAAPARRGRNSGPPSIIQLSCGSMILGTPVCSWWLHPGELSYHRKKRKIDSQKWAHDNDILWYTLLRLLLQTRDDRTWHYMVCWCPQQKTRM